MSSYIKDTLVLFVYLGGVLSIHGSIHLTFR